MTVRNTTKHARRAMKLPLQLVGQTFDTSIAGQVEVLARAWDKQLKGKYIELVGTQELDLSNAL